MNEKIKQNLIKFNERLKKVQKAVDTVCSGTAHKSCFLGITSW